MKLKTLFMLLLAFTVAHAQNKGKTTSDEGIFAEMETSKGKILLQLEYQKTPVTVANFLSLAEGNNPIVNEKYKGKPFFDGLKFHRVIADFMIQGGDPLGNGSGDPGYKFKDEFTDLKHSGPGILSMANSGPATNGSQFFITHKATPWLDGKHTVFGHVVTGQDVVNAIAQDDKIVKVTIIRKGKEAKKFDAAKIFGSYYNGKAEEEKKKMEAEAAARALAEQQAASAKAQKKPYLDQMHASATKTASGLEYKVLKSGSGVKPADGTSVYIYYAGYLPDGSLFDTNYEDIAKAYGKFDQNRADQNGYKPFPFQAGNKGGLIPGFIEALEKMGFNDKLIAFIPSQLAYGEKGAGHVIPPNSDIIFEIELVEKQ